MNQSEQKKVAILSMLFNWPSTAGGIIHTSELAKFLSLNGVEVKHFSARFDPWDIGKVEGQPLHPVTSIEFSPAEWNQNGIRNRFRNQLDEFRPDFVVVTDSWNTKPLLAEAASHYPYFIRIAAQECICPLNNVRLLYNQDGFYSCPKNQFATPSNCSNCVARLDKLSGGLHQAERTLGGFYEAKYSERLKKSFANARSVLAVNPFVQTTLSPYCNNVRVVPSGFDESRFDPVPHNVNDTRKGFVFAGLANEPMKGFSVAHQAAQLLYQKRQDFEIVVTDKKPDNAQEFPFVRYVGWQSQDQLPDLLADNYALIFPTIAEEGLGRSAIEAMAMQRPVIASRIGGLQHTVQDYGTGLLVEPNNPRDLAEKMDRLLEDEPLAASLGVNGRARFESEYTWSSVINNHYFPLFEIPHHTSA